jgi:predicted DCC family thiol-disulfide oxidoreductase YuxK
VEPRGEANPSETPAGIKPVLVYDGDCGFCFYWVRYWHRLTGDEVTYAPYQDVAPRYPNIPLDAFKRGVQYIAPNGKFASNAKASFATLSHARGKAFWFKLYCNLPPFAFVSELAYTFISRRRELAFRVSRFLWGRELEPPRYELVSWLFLRLFALIYLAAFASFGVQALGLVGSHGILPLTDYIDVETSRLGLERYYLMPMVFWLSSSDFMIEAVCWAGVGLSLLLFLNVLPRLNLFLLYALYLSLLYAGQAFMNFQWDVFLLEAGFLALILSFATTPGIWLLRWLLFRFMFMSGVVKLASGDPNWWGLSALSYHFLTQPLPTPLAWYAAQLPAGFLKLATGATFFIELVLPFFLFFPRRLRFAAGFGILLLECLIFLTGNYNWFNLQTMLLCLVLFDDQAVKKILPGRFIAFLAKRSRAVIPGKAVSYTVGALATLIVFASLVEMDWRFEGRAPAFALAVDELIEPFHIVSGYGLFAIMTTERNEIVIEGSNDGADWREYGFRYKPGDLSRTPPWNIPHQPRLDWQMWFAALGPPEASPWFTHLLERLLQNQPDVLALLATNPFPDAAPRYVRAQFYDYTYASAEEKAKGTWWKRRPLRLFFPASELAPGAER